MDFDCPIQDGFTIYSKSGCFNCQKIKNELKEKGLAFQIIDCDEYIIENKNEFLQFIFNLTQKNVKFFPIIFYNAEFVGSYNEAKDLIGKLISFNENENF